METMTKSPQLKSIHCTHHVLQIVHCSKAHQVHRKFFERSCEIPQASQREQGPELEWSRTGRRMPQRMGLASYKPQTMVGIIGQDVHVQVLVMDGLFANEHSWKAVRTTLAYACLRH